MCQDKIKISCRGWALGVVPVAGAATGLCYNLIRFCLGELPTRSYGASFIPFLLGMSERVGYLDALEGFRVQQIRNLNIARGSHHLHSTSAVKNYVESPIPDVKRRLFVRHWLK